MIINEPIVAFLGSFTGSVSETYQKPSAILH